MNGAQRGAAGATRRNALPEVFGLPEITIDHDIAMINHSLILQGHTNFNQPSEKIIQYQEINHSIGCFNILSSSDGIDIQYIYDWHHAGSPLRDQTPINLGKLQIDQWAKIAYNGRFSYESAWIYRYQIINLGLFAAYTPTVFLDTLPIYRYRQIAKLR